jgi:hypothetical protein
LEGFDKLLSPPPIRLRVVFLFIFPEINIYIKKRLPRLGKYLNYLISPIKQFTLIGV